MQKTANLFLVLILLFSAATYAQELQCGASQKWQDQLAKNPELQEKRDALNAFTERWIEEHYTAEIGRAVVTIPVVVHVVYRTTSQNITNAQIVSQIDVLNEDYRKMNADISNLPGAWNSLAADVEIEFQLATCDPDGYATNGITRTETTVTSWNGSDDVKVTSEGGHDPWPSSDYLNIWVCNIGAGLLGYAYPPGISPFLDGVVIGYRYFGNEGNVSGTYGLGRTATHEIGHWLNLDHLWGQGVDNSSCTADDGVSDTPKQDGPNYGCNRSFPHVSCSNGPNGDMFNNYMDYGNDVCLFFFTNGQKSRMLAALNGPRASLLSSNGLNQCPVGIEEQVLQSSLHVYPNPVSDVVNIQSDQTDNLVTDIRIIDLSGREMLRQTNIRLGHAPTQIIVSALSEGTYVLEIRSENEFVSHKINVIK